MKNTKKGYVLIISLIVILLAGGYFIFVKKSGSLSQQSNSIINNEKLVEFEEAINGSDYNNASKYLLDKVYVILEGSSCCGEISKNEAIVYLKNNTKGLMFTFNPNDEVVKKYFVSQKIDFPNRRLVKDSPKLYFDELIVGVESNVSQKNKATIGYKVSNGKIYFLFINKGRDDIYK